MTLLDKACIMLGAFALVSVGLGCLKGFMAIGFATALSPYGSSPQAVSPAPPLQSTIAGEQSWVK